MFRATDPIYIHTRAHVYIYTHIGATYIEIHISWGRDHRRVYLFTPTPPRLLIPIFTEPRRCGRVRTSVKSVSKVAIKFHPTFFFPLDKYIYIYISSLKKERKKGRRRRNSWSRRIVHSGWIFQVSWNTTTGKYELRGKVAVGRVGHSSSSSPRDDVSRQLY